MGFWKKPSWGQERRRTGVKLVAQRDIKVMRTHLKTVNDGLEVLTLLAVACRKPTVQEEIWKFLRQKGINQNLTGFFRDTHRFHVSLEQQLRGVVVGEYAALTSEQNALLSDLGKLNQLLPTLRRKWGI